MLANLQNFEFRAGGDYHKGGWNIRSVLSLIPTTCTVVSCPKFKIQLVSQMNEMIKIQVEQLSLKIALPPLFFLSFLLKFRSFQGHI